MYDRVSAHKLFARVSKGIRICGNLPFLPGMSFSIQKSVFSSGRATRYGRRGDKAIRVEVHRSTE